MTSLVVIEVTKALGFRISSSAARCTRHRSLSIPRPFVSRSRSFASSSSEHQLPPSSHPPLDLHLDDLVAALPQVEVSTNSYELELHGHGESYHPTAMPDVVLKPKTAKDVALILQHATKFHLPVIPYGAGTSGEGEINAIHGGISLDMAEFKNIDIAESPSDDSIADPYAVVGAGVTRKQLNQALRHTGMQFVVDPGADATLGGMVATSASGTTTVRYGGMRENILALECVVPPKTPDEPALIIQVGTKALKNSAGYDLVSLFCGSEGTLGVITSVTVKLHPIPEHVVAATCQFESLYQAASAVAMLKLCCHGGLTRCELLDSSAVQAFNAYNHENPDIAVKPTLFLEFQGHSDTFLDEMINMTENICVQDYGGSSFDCASAEEDRHALWSARHSLLYASLAMRPGATGAIITDACVPLSKFAELIDQTAADVKEKGVVGPCFGHAADGNFHVILPVKDDDTDEDMEILHGINDRLIDRTLAVGGTCTGEHGIGYGKMVYLKRQYGQGGLDVMVAVKASLDPHNIMNPGKVVVPKA